MNARARPPGRQRSGRSARVLARWTDNATRCATDFDVILQVADIIRHE